MVLLPAIDLYEGKAVRLVRGDYAAMTAYSGDPVSVGLRLKAQGAEMLHMVDLEGAKTGGSPNLPLVRAVAEATGLPIELGGGLRDMAAVDRALSQGAARVILGTAAVTDEPFLRAALDKYGGRVAVGADVRDGWVAVRGWTENSSLRTWDFFEKLERLGVETVICTDISRDGVLGGTNLELYAELVKAFRVRLIASGGVSCLEDLLRLKELGLWGAIVGKAWYTGAIDLPAAIKAVRS